MALVLLITSAPQPLSSPYSNWRLWRDPYHHPQPLGPPDFMRGRPLPLLTPSPTALWSPGGLPPTAPSSPPQLLLRCPAAPPSPALVGGQPLCSTCTTSWPRHLARHHCR
ncbi:hypothetical protein GOP47_0019255, partial [Adiantum capillus-veneris]